MGPRVRNRRWDGPWPSCPPRPGRTRHLAPSRFAPGRGLGGSHIVIDSKLSS
ncbi:hypothetical protein SVEN_3380 [Streptomyces venezuelae ATCC 10712]|uniref:Uncharacterized protein n=1 Tax=Streptomyces venezuelae (strain ATCC 10712 / CBS 650.69 / DSM 40230 / JCM 4526 / NBRC 13096 / PD 04745) TaxID=953739 RepID=F2RAI4_STRVP|nr:hypothetical protein SVEN_3380 [Streptomyces venezuelae ATCC 10712]